MNTHIVEELSPDVLRHDGTHYFSPMAIARAAYELRHPGPAPEGADFEAALIGRLTETALKTAGLAAERTVEG